MQIKQLAIVAGLLAGGVQAFGQDATLNIYSARHYPTDEALYDNFTKNTGIKINRVDSDDAGILARLKAEGSASPADVILLVDVARLWRGEADGLFQGVKSTILEQAIPAKLRGKAASDGTSSWFGFSTRARVIVYDRLKVKKEDVDTYEELGDAKNKGKLCIRSGSHPYNLSLFGAVTEHLGEQKAEAWLRGMVANLASQITAARANLDGLLTSVVTETVIQAKSKADLSYLIWQQAEQNLRKASLDAPIDGTVISIAFRKGDSVIAGARALVGHPVMM